MAGAENPASSQPNPLAGFLQTQLSNLLKVTHALPPAWASLSTSASMGKKRETGRGLSVSDMEERLAGVPVYALSNAAEEFVLVSGGKGKEKAPALGLLCFGKNDAEALLDQMRSMDPRMRAGSRIVPLALNKVFQLKVDGVSFRLIPESSQIKHALKLRRRDGFSDGAFPGVPVFQSRSLILRSQDHSYRPVFFRKEDLESSLERASREQNRLNPALRPGDMQVAVLEEIIKGMKENSSTRWEDVVFIPPGFDVSTDPSRLSASGSN